jgi:hypothetical protein
MASIMESYRKSNTGKPPMNTQTSLSQCRVDKQDRQSKWVIHQTIKVGYPSYLSPTSGLGKLLERMGCKLEIGKELDPEDCLVGKAVSFVVVNEKSKKDGNTYSKVVQDSVKSAHTITREK